MEHLTDIDPIVTKFLREEPLSPEEKAALDRWISQGEGRSQMLDNLKNNSDSTKAKLLEMEQMSDTRIWDVLENRLQQEGYWQDQTMAEVVPLSQTRPSRRLLWRYLAAASLVIAIAVSAWLGLRHTSSPAPIAAQPPKPADIAPGGNRATLTLADGRRINLDSSATGLIASQGNMQVSKLADGQLAYQPSGSDNSGAALYNLLATPRAGQFALKLPDGSRVWLNNASSLRYPVAFFGAKREVELTGEAYFEVSKDATHPFIVHTSGGPAGPGFIEVLGTSFNIMAYNDESAERTTLVDGSIRYTHAAGNVLLKPEEQAVLDAHGLKTLHNVNIGEITAWKNGYFHFDHTSLPATMRQLARWYDITVSYEGNVPAQEFIGKIQRNMPLSNVLKGLESDHVHFRLSGRELTVTP